MGDQVKRPGIQQVAPEGMDMRSLFQASQTRDWAAFFKINCNALFETALLLTADPEEAEASVAEVIDHVDVSISPDESDLSNLQEQIARRAAQAWQQPASSQVAEAGLMLRSDLRPLLQIDKCPRICFVLRMLLGYTISTCAQKLGIEESTAKILLRTAILQLQTAVATNDLCEERFQGTPHQVSDTNFSTAGNPTDVW